MDLLLVFVKMKILIISAIMVTSMNDEFVLWNFVPVFYVSCSLSKNLDHLCKIIINHLCKNTHHLCKNLDYLFLQS